MARAIAKCTCKTCGAEFEKIGFRYNRAAADSWADFAAEHYDECIGCWEARKKAEREEENRKAAEMATEAGFPELSGSEKQKAWANSIRKKAIDKLDNDAEICISRMKAENESGNEERANRWKKALDNNILVRTYIIRSYTSASWWIDNRNTQIESIARKVFAEAKKASESEIHEAVCTETI